MKLDLSQLDATPPTVDAIAEVLGVHRNAVQRAINELNLPAGGFLAWYRLADVRLIAQHLIAEELEQRDTPQRRPGDQRPPAIASHTSAIRDGYEARRAANLKRSRP